VWHHIISHFRYISSFFYLVNIYIYIYKNVKLSLCFNWAPRHEGVLGEWRYSYAHSLTSALDGGEWSASRPNRFTPRERAPGTYCIRGWVGPRAVLDAVVKRKIPSPRRESNSRTPIVQPVAQRYTDWAITALIYKNAIINDKVSTSISVYFKKRRSELRKFSLIINNESLL
jgi:hypothetical protein